MKYLKEHPSVVYFLFGFAYGFLLSMAVFIPSANANHVSVCEERVALLYQAEKEYKEAPISRALATDGRILEVLVSPTGTFTIIMTDTNGVSCVMAVGEGWENVPYVLMQGEGI